MKILKFALGVRFDMLLRTVDDKAKQEIFCELTHTVSARMTDGLHIYGGCRKLFPNDGDNIYTVVFMNGSLKQMRRLYRKIDGDARLRAMMERKTPYIQNNVIRDFDDLEYLGEVNSMGEAVGGDNTAFHIRFESIPDARMAYVPNERIVIAADSFKGTLSSRQVNERLSFALRNAMPCADIQPIPAADGGEGTVDAIENAILCRRRPVTVTAPNGKRTEAFYLVIGGGKAVIESAQAAGLSLVPRDERDVLNAATTGVGEMILRAASEGVREIFVGLGGSATNDCGIGAARAMGFSFLDECGAEVVNAADMQKVVSIDDSAVPQCVKNVKYIAMCDVTNPLTGKNGATYTYGAQKGADAQTLEALERGMLNMKAVLEKFAKRPIGELTGAGAAGGMGAMLFGLLNAEYAAGAEAVLGIAGFDKALKSAKFVVTGEGKVDATSSNGKLCGIVLGRANSAGVPAAIIAGCRGDGADAVEGMAEFCEYCSECADADALQQAEARFDAAAERLAKKMAQQLSGASKRAGA